MTEIAPPAWGMAALPPDITGAALLTDPGLVLAPDFKAFGLGVSRSDLVQARGEAPFLKSSCAF